MKEIMAMNGNSSLIDNRYLENELFAGNEKQEESAKMSPRFFEE
jgi:hypothetical protein